MSTLTIIEPSQQKGMPTGEGSATARFGFLAESLNGTGGYAACVVWSNGGVNSMRRPKGVSGPSYLIPYPRENLEKYACRVASTPFESHLREAVERFTAYMGRKSPQRDGADGPLTAMLLNDADNCGNHLDVFWQNFMQNALARGSMLLLIDMPMMRTDRNMAETLQGVSRNVPYLKSITPESISSYKLRDDGLFDFVDIADTELINGRMEPVTRRFDAQGWQVLRGNDVVRQGVHPFGQCPVLAYTENCSPYPCIGRFAQIADLSNRLYNSRSELIEILRSQGFSLLTQQIATEGDRDAAQNGVKTIGTSAMLFHTGATPAFIAPPNGPVEMLLKEQEELRLAISRIGMEPQINTSTRAESGLSRKLQFEGLNSALARFARAMQDLESKVWGMYCGALGISQSVSVDWPDDYNLLDSQSELDILLTMQQTGFPDEVQIAKRAAIVSAEFDRADPQTLQDLQDAVRNQVHEVLPPSAIEPMAAIVVPAAPMAHPAPMPQPVIFNTAGGAKVIDLVRGADGAITGANVREA
jgi:hypothetical protein